MKRSLVLLLVCSVVFMQANGADAEKPLGAVVEQALAHGTDATLNPFFSRMLGVSAEEGRPIALKRLRDVRGNSTNFFDVSVTDKQTIVLTTREGAQSHYYLTDLSGKLRKAVLNDSTKRIVGLTNIPNSVAQENFERAKQSWLTKHGSK